MRTELLSPGLQLLPLRAAFAPTGAFGSVRAFLCANDAHTHRRRAPLNMETRRRP